VPLPVCGCADVDAREDDARPGVADAIGGAALYPARVAARAWRARLETAAEEVLSAPETARVVDRALAGPLPEELVRSLVRHRVVERVMRELAATGELERLLEAALASPESRELADRVLASDEMRRALERVASGPEVRGAIASQSTGLAEEVVRGLRAAAVELDQRAERAVSRRDRPAPPPFAGVGTRGAALAIDAAATTVICAAAGAVAGLVASLVGGVRPQWLAGALLAAGWALLTGGYFTVFWAAAGQTPGMRLLHVRVRPKDGDGRVTVARAVVRTIGLALAIVPLFLGFLPALFDARRRALPDYLAGTVVVYDEAPDDRRV
jgi:uncharacterized RDD family membrane protein YckC